MNPQFLQKGYQGPMDIHQPENSDHQWPASSWKQANSTSPSCLNSASSAPIPGSNLDAPPEFHVVTESDTDGSSWYQSNEGQELVQKWGKIGNCWTGRARAWSQQESDWYKEMGKLYHSWSIDEGSDKSKYPKELDWATKKLDQARRETEYCKSWIAYAKWQIGNKSGLAVGACPMLPSFEGRVLLADLDNPPQSINKKGEKDDDGNGDKMIQDEASSAEYGFAKAPYTRAPAEDRQGPRNGNTREGQQDYSEVTSSSQRSTVFQSHFQTFTQPPLQEDSFQITNHTMIGELANVFYLSEDPQGYMASHDPSQTCVQTSKTSAQISERAATQVGVETNVPTKNFVQASFKTLNQQFNIQSSGQTFITPVPTPLQAFAELSGPAEMLETSQLPIADQFPTLTSEEFVALRNGTEPSENSQPQKPTRKLTQKQSKNSFLPSTKKITKKSIQRSKQQSTSAHSLTQDNVMTHKEASFIQSVSVSAEPRQDIPTATNNLCHSTPAQFPESLAPTVPFEPSVPPRVPEVLTDPVDTTEPAMATDPEVSKIVSDWWDIMQQQGSTLFDDAFQQVVGQVTVSEAEAPFGQFMDCFSQCEAGSENPWGFGY